MNTLFRAQWLIALSALSTTLMAQHPTSAANTKSQPAPAAVAAVTSAATATGVTTTTGGTKGTIPVFTTTNNIENSTLYYSTTGLGIGRFPSQMLDVNGNSVFRGYMQVSRTADATASTGTKSYPIQFNLQVFDSTRGIALNPFFNFQAEPTGNNTASTGATLNLLYFGGVGAPTAAETGLYFNKNGVIHFASAQTFPITQGPQGPAGPQGATGPAGPQGPAGTLALPYSKTTTTMGSSAYLFYLVNSGADATNAIYGEGASGNANYDNGGSGLIGRGGAAAGAHNQTGGTGIVGYGGREANVDFSLGGTGVTGQGAQVSQARSYGGTGGVFYGGQAPLISGDGVIGYGANGSNGGRSGVGIYGVAGNSNDAATDFAGYFQGNVGVEGNLSKSGGSFKIDHPLDPENRYLSHSFVESPDMKNIYDGIVVTDGRGEAVVTMPDYFEALNRDFRYQLTILGGQFAQARVASEISRGTFTIMTDKPNVKVSWQVTGIRQDAWANAHRIPNEEEKTSVEKGHFIHPELFGHAGQPSAMEMSHPMHIKSTPQQ